MAMGAEQTVTDVKASYVPNQPYEDKRGLELPRILIPPPIIDYECGRASFHVAAEDFERADARCGNPQFMRSLVSHSQLKLEHIMSSWHYENRRNAQSILPFLLIGPSTVARDAAFIQTSGVTFLLAVRSALATSKHPGYLDPSRFASASGLQTATFDLDTPWELISNIRPVIKRLNDHLEATCSQSPITSINDVHGKVMIFCETGNERSAVVVAAYLMYVYGISTVAAIQVIQSQRFCANIDDGMKNILLALEDVITAEREVAASRFAQSDNMSELAQTGHNVPSLAKSSKRSLDDAEDSDDEMADSADWNGGQTQRAGVAPFTDVGP